MPQASPEPLGEAASLSTFGSVHRPADALSHPPGSHSASSPSRAAPTFSAEFRQAVAARAAAARGEAPQPPPASVGHMANHVADSHCASTSSRTGGLVGPRHEADAFTNTGGLVGTDHVADAFSSTGGRVGTDHAADAFSSTGGRVGTGHAADAFTNGRSGSSARSLHGGVCSARGSVHHGTSSIPHDVNVDDFGEALGSTWTAADDAEQGGRGEARARLSNDVNAAIRAVRRLADPCCSDSGDGMASVARDPGSPPHGRAHAAGSSQAEGAAQPPLPVEKRADADAIGTNSSVRASGGGGSAEGVPPTQYWCVKDVHGRVASHGTLMADGRACPLRIRTEELAMSSAAAQLAAHCDAGGASAVRQPGGPCSGPPAAHALTEEVATQTVPAPPSLPRAILWPELPPRVPPPPPPATSPLLAELIAMPLGHGVPPPPQRFADISAAACMAPLASACAPPYQQSYH